MTDEDHGRIAADAATGLSSPSAIEPPAASRPVGFDPSRGDIDGEIAARRKTIGKLKDVLEAEERGLLFACCRKHNIAVGAIVSVSHGRGDDRDFKVTGIRPPGTGDKPSLHGVQRRKDGSWGERQIDLWRGWTVVTPAQAIEAEGGDSVAGSVHESAVNE